MGLEASVEMSASEPSANATILVVDDNEHNREILSRRLVRDGHRVLQAENGRQALDVMRCEPVDTLLLDLMMPVMDGYETLAAIKRDSSLRHIPVIVVTAVDETEGAVRCIEQGAEDYVGKPIDLVLLRARLRACLNKKRLYDLESEYRREIERHNHALEEQVREQVREISSTQLAAIFAMSKLAESKDPETGEHLERMREYCVVLSRELARQPAYASVVTPEFHDNIYAASPLHDIGKVGIPDRVLLKPGKLSEEEWLVMRQHPLIGADTLRAVDRQYPGNQFIRTGIDIAQCHHERWDGSGYPNGLRAQEIPLAARILALGDVYDALTSRRCYKDKFSHQESRSIIVDQAGRHFDPDVVKAFLEREEEFVRIRNHFQDPDEA